jgi:four helix bundle protein
VQDFKRLRVWQKADQLTVDVYFATRDFPRDERFLLTAQLRSAVLSIQANIAEGTGRATRADTARFLTMATGSAAEVANHLHVAHRLGYLSRDVYRRLNDALEHVRRMLIRLLMRLKSHV